MKIRLLRDLKIPFLDRGTVLEVHAVTECRGEPVYFIHHMSAYLGICGRDCEIWDSQK